MNGGCEYPMMNPSDYRYSPCGKPATATIRGHAYCARHDPHRAAEIEDRVRLAAEDVVQAADLAFSRQMTERDAEIMEAPLARIALAVLAHRKAKAEQAKERAT